MVNTTVQLAHRMVAGQRRVKTGAAKIDGFRRRASADADIRKLELDKAIQANQQVPGTTPDAEIRRLSRSYEEAKALVGVD